MESQIEKAFEEFEQFIENLTQKQAQNTELI